MESANPRFASSVAISGHIKVADLPIHSSKAQKEAERLDTNQECHHNLLVGRNRSLPWLFNGDCGCLEEPGLQFDRLLQMHHQQGWLCQHAVSSNRSHNEISQFCYFPIFTAKVIEASIKCSAGSLSNKGKSFFVARTRHLLSRYSTQSGYSSAHSATI